MVDAILHAAFHNATVGALLAAIAWGVTRLWRNPLVARWLWLIVLVKFLTPPLWQVPVAISIWPASQQFQVDQTFSLIDPHENGTSLSDATSSLAVAAGATAQPTLRWTELVLIAWAITSLSWLGLAFYRVTAFDQAQHESATELPELSRRVNTIAARLGLQRVPQVRAVSAQIAPMLWSGWGRAVILVPRELLGQLTASQLDAVLAHELVHFRRGDHWIRRLSLVALSLYWWHPAVWLACRQLRENEENCCDATVLERLTIDRQSYAETLFQTVCFTRGMREPLPALGFARENHLKRRVETILDSTLSLRPTRLARLAVLAWAAVIPLSVRLVASEETADVASDPSTANTGTETVTSESSTGATPVQTVSLSPATTLLDDFPAWRVQRPYGDIGFPGNEFGPHWETVRLATHEGVLEEIDASDDQRIQLKGVWNSLLGKSRQWSQVQRGLPDLLKSEYEQVTTILSQNQLQRVRELIVQRKGLSAFLDDELSRQMDLSSEQVEGVRRAIQDHSRRVKVRNEALEQQLKSIAIGKDSTDIIAEKLRLSAP